jgi:hydrogenase expression/formation protein HypE
MNDSIKKIQPGHGSGGKLMNDMIDKTIIEILGPDSIQLDDSAVLDIPVSKIAFTTDTFVVTPIEFPGGNIGTLAINGTVNDLAVMGATPKYISCGLILEEGFPFEDFERILRSMKKEADEAGVAVVTGDTKVVPHGKCDKIYINTTGVGIFEKHVQRNEIKAGDKIIVSGTIGDHGMTIMAKRNDLKFSSDMKSDCTYLNHMIKDIIDSASNNIKFIRDATRGGVASVLNEIIKNKEFGAKLIESDIPVHEEVEGICNILGLDPLYVANEGKIIVICSKNTADSIIQKMNQHPQGREGLC